MNRKTKLLSHLDAAKGLNIDIRRDFREKHELSVTRTEDSLMQDEEIQTVYWWKEKTTSVPEVMVNEVVVLSFQQDIVNAFVDHFERIFASNDKNHVFNDGTSPCKVCKYFCCPSASVDMNVKSVLNVSFIIVKDIVTVIKKLKPILCVVLIIFRLFFRKTALATH